MSTKQDKATTEKHAKMLRELLKNPENKVCADCKRNDPRWASWNLGVFLCIRCSGIHRSMGTHISKVKSVDLDVWTVEQMTSIQKWGNRRANLYWEAHLKAGHIPPDHKMDSFIRSKYESRRWAMDGPPPTDPSVLDNGAVQETPASAPAPAPIATSSSSASRSGHASSNSTSSLRSPVTTRQPQPHQLLSTAVAARSHAAAQPVPAPPQQAPAPAAPTPSASNDLFSLDFHNPTPPAAAPAQKKDVKQDILSLFSTPAAPAAQPAFGQFGVAQAQAQNAWGQFAAAPVAAAPVQATSMMGTTGWGATAGWNGQPAVAAQQNVWGATSPTAQQQMPQQNLFNTNDIWASASTPAAGSGTGSNGFGAPLPGMARKDDVFGDLWGGFK